MTPMPRAAYVYFRLRKRDTRCTLGNCEPVALIQESPADCELTPCRDMGVVEAWETRDREGCSTAFDGWERESTLSKGDGESESEMQGEEERKKERECATMRGNEDGCS